MDFGFWILDFGLRPVGAYTPEGLQNEEDVLILNAAFCMPHAPHRPC